MTLDADGRAYVGGFGFDFRTAGSINGARRRETL
jgi:hypothetical protein